MENCDVDFNETDLKRVVFCAVLMSSIDRDVHEKEWEVIESFVNAHWKEEYGRFVDFQKNLLYEIYELLETESELYQKIDEIIDALVADLDQGQKDAVLELVGDVMAADDIMAMEESNLFANLFERLETPTPPPG